MLPDNGSRRESDPARSPRALGRGLEDISHLFLSAPGDQSAKAPLEHSGSEERPGATAPRARVAVLRPGTALGKDQLVATLLECRDALEEGMRALDAAVWCDAGGEIDLLALDRFNRLIIVDVDTTLGEGLLLRGISHVDWVARNVANLRRMYQTTSIDSSRQPRLILVAPRFSRLVTGALRQVTGPAVTCFRYHTVASFGGTGILLEPLHDGDE